MNGDIERYLLLRAIHDEANRPSPPVLRQYPVLARISRWGYTLTTLAAVVSPVIVSGGDLQFLALGALLAACYWIPAQVIYSLIIRPGHTVGIYLNLAWMVIAWCLGVGFYFWLYSESQAMRGAM